MRDPVMSLLREAVRAEISNAFEAIGHARPREVARVVCALHPSDVHRIGARLAEDALTDIARRELKRRPSKQERAQITLPGIPDALQAYLPPAISVPPPGVELESVDDEGVIYKPLAQATLADVDAHLALLGAQISADTRRHRALKELRDLALAAGATGDSPLLATLSAANVLTTEGGVVIRARADHPLQNTTAPAGPGWARRAESWHGGAGSGMA